MAHALPAPLLMAIRREFPADFLSLEPPELARYGTDWLRRYDAAPSALAFPRSADEVAELVRLCAQHRVAMVPSGGRTGLVGGAVAVRGEVIVSLERMHRIGAVDVAGQTVRVEAGAVTAAVHQACAAHGLYWPIELAAKGSSHIGGNLATNAGGVRVIRYGHARNWVLGLAVVTAAGEQLELGGALEKDNTGIDLRQLFIGSEGTLGLITAATLKLTQLPREGRVLLFAVSDPAAAMCLLTNVRRSNFTLAAYEMFTDRCMARLTRHRKLTPPLAASTYVLVELEGAEEEALLDWLAEALALPGVLDAAVSYGRAQARALWELREGISESINATGVPHKNDVALPVAALAAFISELEAVFAAEYPGWEICLFGHVGDGNLHINTIKPDDMDEATFRSRTQRADHVIFSLVQRYGGSISAEHGIGLVKKDYLGYSRSPAEVALQRAIKCALDPQNLLNPGKIFDVCDSPR